MKRLTLLLLALLVIAPACKKKPAAQHPVKEEPVLVQNETTSVEVSTDNNGKKSLFIEDDIEQFMLQKDDAADAFAPTTDNQESKSEIVIEEIDDQKLRSKHADQAKYGFSTIYFPFNSYQIEKKQLPALEHNLTVLKKTLESNPDFKAVIEGHSCRFAGSAAYNMQLSDERAQAVANYFVKQGIPAERMNEVGRGDTEPIVPTTGNKEQQAPNRRVNIYIWKA
jgi:outer membrane protein OmpA-like peptidoglycan-associated protein